MARTMKTRLAARVGSLAVATGLGVSVLLTGAATPASAEVGSRVCVVDYMTKSSKTYFVVMKKIKKGGRCRPFQSQADAVADVIANNRVSGGWVHWNHNNWTMTCEGAAKDFWWIREKGYVSNGVADLCVNTGWNRGEVRAWINRYDVGHLALFRGWVNVGGITRTCEVVAVDRIKGGTRSVRYARQPFFNGQHQHCWDRV